MSRSNKRRPSLIDAYKLREAVDAVESAAKVLSGEKKVSTNTDPCREKGTDSYTDKGAVTASQDSYTDKGTDHYTDKGTDEGHEGNHQCNYPGNYTDKGTDKGTGNYGCNDQCNDQCNAVSASPVFDFSQSAGGFAHTRYEKRFYKYLKSNPNVFTKYDEIADKTKASVDAIKKIARRWRDAGHIETKPFYQGSVRGVHITLLNNDYTDKGTDDYTDKGTDEGTDDYTDNSPSKIDRSFSLKENLSIYQSLKNLTDADIKSCWPELYKIDFRVSQVEQILKRLATKNISLDQIHKSLDHANWELEHENMLSKDGKPVAKPLGYIFVSLADTGYYRRPKGYVSKEEQVLKDQLEEKKRLLEVKRSLEAVNEQIEAEDERLAYATWEKSLSEEDRQMLIEEQKAKTANPKFGYSPPKGSLLRLAWVDERDAGKS